jgi:predicted  nucleic acid-binding Zn-ribbon protein
MENKVNKILSSIAPTRIEKLKEHKKLQFSISDNVDSAYRELSGYLQEARNLIEDAAGVYDEWERATNDVANLSQDIIELNDRIEETGDIMFLQNNLQESLNNYNRLADELGVDPSDNVMAASDLLEDLQALDFEKWLYSEGGRINDAASVANKFLP